MKREDWNWVALLCMGQLFSGIVKTIIQGITGKEMPFFCFLVIYGIFCAIITVLFSGSKVFDHTKFFIPMVVFLTITFVAVFITAIISVILSIKAFEELLMYIIIAVLGVLICGISKKFCN